MCVGVCWARSVEGLDSVYSLAILLGKLLLQSTHHLLLFMETHFSLLNINNNNFVYDIN